MMEASEIVVCVGGRTHRDLAECLGMAGKMLCATYSVHIESFLAGGWTKGGH